MPRFYLTTAIDYVNSRPHLGTAYEKITADVIARYKRLSGVDTHFVMGNDEHSQNVFRRARDLGKDPLAYCDGMEQEFREVWRALDVSFDDFIRTTQPRHKAAVETIVSRIAAAGDLYQADYEGWYCVGCEAFKQEKDLVEGLCPIHRTKPDWIKERNHFFKLSAYRDRLLAHFAEHPDFLQPEVRRNEILRLLEAGLEDISISRAGQSWGIPLPDRSVERRLRLVRRAHQLRVGRRSRHRSRRCSTPGGRPTCTWSARTSRASTASIWPAMLMSAGLPRAASGVRPRLGALARREDEQVARAPPSIPLEAAQRFGADALRLFLTKEIPYGADGDFTFERFEERYNADLANNLGNLVNRVTAMGVRYRQGRIIPTGSPSRLQDLAATTVQEYGAAMETYALHSGIASVYRLLDATNEYLAERAPWTLAKDPANAAALDEVLFTAAESLRIATVLLGPVMPGDTHTVALRTGDVVAAEAQARDKRAIDLWRLDRDAVWRTDGVRVVTAGDPIWPRHLTMVADPGQPRSLEHPPRCTWQVLEHRPCLKSSRPSMPSRPPRHRPPRPSPSPRPRRRRSRRLPPMRPASRSTTS